MRPSPDPRGQKNNLLNLTLAVAAGLVGCLTLVIVLAAVFGGLWLDQRFGTKPWYTVGLLIASIPVSLFVMFLVVRAAVARIKIGRPEANIVREEEDELGEHHGKAS